ncbi:uncharacterized protein BDCG_16395 [Blastomyces dermatitidis ER-3]|uniref:Uncharacterized protein n=1 Tax=Ajellomyces dermatitidis (strain ER-3 / ATCC MYA-2586) TaxID=559297 RepID=A0ABX2VRV2_AJEDR|nr:uncharacterized protein BDCG_16395 [Blastomyces dermatitidis ER-3]OAS99950.1 hypothetical protein BDCG_16395 [Blastomyces dermatitidis ER-3]
MKSLTVFHLHKLDAVTHDCIFTLLSPVTAPDLQASSSPHSSPRPVPGFKQCSLSLCLSSAAPRAYDHLFPACTISDQAYVNMPRFPINGPRAAAHFCNPIANGRWVSGYPQNPGNQGNANVMNL